MNNLIGISGHIQSGKDLLTSTLQEMFPEQHYENKKYADTIKDIVCMLIGCTREDLEDKEFKNTELGKEWHINSYRKGY